MLRVLLAAAAICGLTGAQDMPVARPSASVQGPVAAPRAHASRGELPPLAVIQIDPRDVTLDSPRRLSLTFAEPRPIDEILALLTFATGFSVSVDRDATGSFRGELKQLTLRESLNTILAPLGLDFEARGSVIRVRTRQTQTRMFELDLLNVRRGLSRTAGTSAASLSSTAAQDDVMSAVADGVKALLSDRGSVHVDRRGGLVQVTDFADRLERVALYVETIQQRSARQVRLQAQAFEVTLRDAASIDWQMVRNKLGVASAATDAAMAIDPAALRGALAQQGDVRLLWAPEVTTINNEPVLVRMATEGGTALTMTIVPQISADGIVQMSVSHAWEEKVGERKTSEADTVTRVMDGSTAVIAGLLRGGRAELVLLLRPTVVTAGGFIAGNRD